MKGVVGPVNGQDAEVATVADQVCAFESRQSRSYENQTGRDVFCETNPISGLGHRFGRLIADLTARARKIQTTSGPLSSVARLRNGLGPRCGNAHVIKRNGDLVQFLPIPSSSLVDPIKLLPEAQRTLKLIMPALRPVLSLIARMSIGAQI
jgi:hypothetical protein